jgi:hypothetical protein
MIVSPWPDLDALSDQDAPDTGGCAAAQNAEIIQAGTIEIAPGQLLGRDRDRPPWIPLNHLPVPTTSPPQQQYAGAGNKNWLICATVRPPALAGRSARGADPVGIRLTRTILEPVHRVPPLQGYFINGPAQSPGVHDTRVET